MGIDPVSLLAEAGAAIAEAGSSAAAYVGSTIGLTSATAGAGAASASEAATLAEAAAATDAAYGVPAAAASGAAAASSSSLANIAIASSLASGAVGGYGAIQTAHAQAGAAKYNAAIEARNAQISKANAQIAEQSGEAQGGIQGLRTKAAIGNTLAGEAASGVDVNSMSFGDVVTSMREIGQNDAQTIRSNAAREAYGYRQQAVSQQDQAQLSRYEAGNASRAGGINAGATLLGSTGTALSEYQRWQLESGQAITV